MKFGEVLQKQKGCVAVMKPFGAKVKDARISLGLSQLQLAENVGVSKRAVNSYEAGTVRPRATTLQKLAKALQVSVTFLSDDSCENPMQDIEKDDYIAVARAQFGGQGAKDMDTLLAESRTFLAGGDVPQEEKDMFFEAIMEAYVDCRAAAKEKYGRKAARPSNG